MSMPGLPPLFGAPWERREERDERAQQGTQQRVFQVYTTTRIYNIWNVEAVSEADARKKAEALAVEHGQGLRLQGSRAGDLEVSSKLAN